MTGDETRCPECGASWIGEPIPLADRHHFGDKAHFSRIIGVEYPERYDGVWEWQCPDCGAVFPRFEA